MDYTGHCGVTTITNAELQAIFNGLSITWLEGIKHLRDMLGASKKELFFKKLVLFSNFGIRAILPIHLIVGCT